MEIKFNILGTCKQCKLGPCKRGAEKCEGLEDDLMAVGGAVMTDWYPSSSVNQSGAVSIERAAREEIEIKNAHDKAVVDENRYGSSSGIMQRKGLPPCKARKYTPNG